MVFLLVASCQSPTKKETVTMDEVMEGSSENYKVDTELVEVKQLELDESFQNVAEKLELPIVDFIAIDSLLFVDRFENVSSYKYLLTNNSSSTFFAQWTFTNASSAKNAFMNWTQCYGARCHSLILNDSTSVSSEHMAMLLVGKELYYMNVINEKRYISFVSALIAAKKWNEIDYAFYQNGKKSVKWFQFEDFK